MRYLNIVFTIIMLLVVITFCVHNTQEFTLTFLGYRFMMPLQLWMLMVVFFVAGMIPIMAVELPLQTSHYLKMRSLRAQISRTEDEMRRLSGSPGGSANEPS